MGILTNLFGQRVPVVRAERRDGLENPSNSLDDPDVWDSIVGADGISDAGVAVNYRTALRLSTVWRGVFLIANTVGKLPLYVYRRDDDGEGKHYASDHPAYALLRRKPSSEITAFTFKQVVTAQAILMGNGCAYIDRAGNATPRQLIPLPPGSCHPVRVDGVLWYVYLPPDGSSPRKLSYWDVYHIKGPGLDGLCGIDLTKKAKDSLGASLAAQTYAAKYFANGAEPRVIFESANKLDPKQREQIKGMWNTMHAGLENVHKTGILENGVSIKAFGLDPESSQLLETRKDLTPIEVANWLHLPATKLGETTGKAFASLEQESQNFLDDSIEPWLVQHEEQCWDKLLTEEQKDSDSHTVEFMRLALMRADAAARSVFYHNALQDGWMNCDEVRSRENLNPMENGLGKTHYRPLNMTPVAQDQDAAFKQKVWLGFQADGTVADVMANLTDMKALTAAVGLPVEDDYTDPWLPIVSLPGLLVTGNPLKDVEGDIVGSDVTANPGAPAIPTPNAPPAKTKAKPIDEANAARTNQMLVATRQLMLDATRRMVTRVRTHAVKSAKGTGGIAGFLGKGIDEHRATMLETIGPALSACAVMRGAIVPVDLLVDGLLAELRRRIVATDGSADAVEAALDWVSKRRAC